MIHDLSVNNLKIHCIWLKCITSLSVFPWKISRNEKVALNVRGGSTEIRLKKHWWKSNCCLPTLGILCKRNNNTDCVFDLLITYTVPMCNTVLYLQHHFLFLQATLDTWNVLLIFGKQYLHMWLGMGVFIGCKNMRKKSLLSSTL